MEPMNSDQRNTRWQKRQLVLALIVSCALMMVLVSLAWLNHTRSLATATKVHVPTLWIDNIHGTNAMNLGEIDVQDVEEHTTDNRPCRRYVFSVKSNVAKPFRLQLAYTTNIPFAYELYPAIEYTQKNGSCVQVGAYFYAYGDPMIPEKCTQAHDATYLTTSVDSEGNATKTVYSEKKVHDMAEPYYWISKEQTLDSTDETEGSYVTKDGAYFTRYYVLEISWDGNLKNNKETDLVYLMAERADS